MTVLLGLVVALVISKVFVATFEKMALLAAFLPVIIATAGAVGLQSSTLVVRAIALGTSLSSASSRSSPAKPPPA